MKKSSQIQPVGATALPERVSVAMAEIAENMHEGLLALAVGARHALVATELDTVTASLVVGQSDLSRRPNGSGQ